MKISRNHRLGVILLAAGLAVVADAQQVDSRWRMQITGPDNRLKVEATIRFTDEAAESCMDGGWKRVVVEEKTLQEDEFFPLSGPLAYKIDHGVVTLGRAYLCDGYLFLSGMKDDSAVRGSYDAIGWGRRRLGAFSMQKIL